MSDESPEKIRPPQHTHVWNLQNDKDFADECARLLKYFVNAQMHIPCVHQDHPSVAAIEIMMDGLTTQLPPQLSSITPMFETFAHVFFAAGQQYAMDGFVSSAHPAFEPTLELAPGKMDDWSKKHLEYMAEWRKDIREKFYRPRPKRGLADIINHIVEEHGDEIEMIDMGDVDEKTILSRLLGPQRTAPEPEILDPDRPAGPYL